MKVDELITFLMLKGLVTWHDSFHYSDEPDVEHNSLRFRMSGKFSEGSIVYCGDDVVACWASLSQEIDSFIVESMAVEYDDLVEEVLKNSA